MLKTRFPIRFAAVLLMGSAFLVTTPGCGERLEQVMKLSAFELPNDRPKSPAYRDMMKAYYRTDPADAGADDLAWIESFDASPLTGERETCLREMYEIQSIDRGERIYGSSSTAEVWVALTPRAKLAVRAWVE